MQSTAVDRYRQMVFYWFYSDAWNQDRLRGDMTRLRLRNTKKPFEEVEVLHGIDRAA